jgi:nucleoside-diphosphate-sugar epimerase
MSSERVQDLSALGEIATGNLADMRFAEEICSDVDTVIHLAANPSTRANWEELHDSNFVATHNIFEAAAQAGCRRLVFPSSINAVSAYPPGYQVHPEDAPSPANLYGASKAFGEAMARLFAFKRDLSCLVLRIGAASTHEKGRQMDKLRHMSMFVSYRDLNQLICRCIDNRNLQFAVFSALSDNPWNCMDISSARQLVGYEPEDNIARINSRWHRLVNEAPEPPPKA